MDSSVDGFSSRRKTIILLSCCMSLLIVSMDSTIVNVALPSIRSELHASLPELQWVIDIYTLTLASLLLLSGATADRFGRRRVFQIGLTTFAVGSLLCSLAPSVEFLIGARLLQGIGGSMLNPVAMSIITQVFTGKVERARAVGVWGAVVGISTAIGPLIGGVLIEVFDWRSVFLINLPICALAIALTVIVVPESKAGAARGIDPIGQTLAMLTIFSLVFGLVSGPDSGWTGDRTLGAFGICTLALAMFLRYEHRRRDPFIDLRFFRSVPFSAATAIAVFAYAAMGAFLFLCSMYLQDVRHFTAVRTGLMYLPMAIGMLVFAPLSGRLVGRYGTRPSTVAAGAMLTIGAIGMTRLRADTSTLELLVNFAVLGVGFGLVNAPITTSAVSGMPLERAGAASGVASTSRQVGVSIGVALCGAAAGTSLAMGRVPATMAVLWWIIAVLAIGILGLGVASTTAWARASRERIAPLLSDSRAKEAVHVR